MPQRPSSVPGSVASDGDEVVGWVGIGEKVFVTQVQDADLASGADLSSESRRYPYST